MGTGRASSKREPSTASMRYRPRTVNSPSETQADPVTVLQADNGLEVHLLHSKEIRSSLGLLSLESPLDDDREAHAVLPDLLTRGTASSPGLAEMAARCEALYETDLAASVTAHGPRQVLRLGFEALADRFAGGTPLFDQASALLAEAIHEPPLEGGRFREDHLGQERTNLARAIAGLQDDRSLVAWRRMVERLHEGTPWALHSWGEQASAEALDQERVLRAWGRIRAELPGRLVLVGDLTADQALAAAASLGGPDLRPPPGAPALPPLRDEHAVIEGHDRMALQQSQLVMGFAVSPELLKGSAAPLLAAVFGGGSHSRLFKRVREGAGLAYGCSATLLVDSATLVVAAGIDGDQAERVREMVLEELSLLATEGPTEDELEVSRSAVRRRLDGIMDSPRELVGWRLFALATGREHRPERVARHVADVGTEDLARVASGTRLAAVYLLEGDAP